MWRPKRWQTPYIGNDYYSVGYELGADAMLEALRKQAQHIDNTTAGNIGDKVLQWGKKGTVVFIPDEPEPKKEEGHRPLANGMTYTP